MYTFESPKLINNNPSRCENKPFTAQESLYFSVHNYLWMSGQLNDYAIDELKQFIDRLTTEEIKSINLDSQEHPSSILDLLREKIVKRKMEGYNSEEG